MPKLEKVACLLRPSHGLSSLHSAGQRPASQQCSWARVHNGPGGPGTCCGPCLSPREGVVLFSGGQGGGLIQVQGTRRRHLEPCLFYI